MKKLTLRFFILFITMKINALAQSLPPNYSEPHRPQFHFSPPAMWMNDPNGMVYYAGEYHLFYQYHPQGDKWGPMHWGHAITRDLVHWEHLPIALEPDSLGYIFSGSVVVDHTNTTGFKTGVDAPLVAMFTYHNMAGEKSGRSDYQYQGIAYSNDKGRTWTKYKGNPVIPNTEGLKDFRDTKVFWYEKTKNWVVILAVADHVRFYNSKDLKTWTLTGTFGKNEGAHGGVWECPDLFQIKIEGMQIQKWVLLQSLGNGAPNGGSGTQYFIGYFNGKTFENDNKPETVLWLDYGRDNYAGVTWSNAPLSRRLFLGWMSNWQYAQEVPTSPWRSAMTLPRELILKKKEGVTRLYQSVVKEISNIFDEKNQENLRSSTTKNEVAFQEKSITLKSSLNFIDLKFNVLDKKAKNISLELSNSKGEKFVFGYEADSNRIFTDRTQSGKTDFSKNFAASRHFAPLPKELGLLHFNIYVDDSSIEIFEKMSGTVMTELFFSTEKFTKLSIKGNENVKIIEGKVVPLKSVW
jgi:fructan beta-fructosidase